MAADKKYMKSSKASCINALKETKQNWEISKFTNDIFKLPDQILLHLLH